MSQPDLTKVLVSALNNQREHVLGSLAGLPDEALRTPMLPTGWSCLGLVQHLTLDVERFWFQQVLMGEKFDAAPVDGNAWQVSPDTPAQAVLDRYRAEIERADAVIAAEPLDTPPAWWPDYFGSFRMDHLGEIIVHVITETATHAGHLDAVRELIDGQTWLILT